MKIQEKAGGVVINPAGHVLIVTNIAGRTTLPKGGLEHGETHEQAAEREVLEEGGLNSVKLIKELGNLQRKGFTESNHVTPTVIKNIKIYYFETQELALQPKVKDIVSAEWVPADLVKERLSWQEEIDFFELHRAELGL